MAKILLAAFIVLLAITVLSALRDWIVEGTPPPGGSIDGDPGSGDFSHYGHGGDFSDGGHGGHGDGGGGGHH